MEFERVSSCQLEDTWKVVEKRRWGHSLHRLCSRIGSFPPTLAHYFIIKYSDPGDSIFDPFCGKGTVPLEACLTRRIGIGNDVAPDAYTITHAKVKPPSLRGVRICLKNLEELIKRNNNKVDLDGISWKIKTFYSPYTLKQILILRDALKNKNNDTRIFVKGLILGILHGSSQIHLSIPSSHSFSMNPHYVKRYAKKHKLKKPDRIVINCLLKRAEAVLKDGTPKTKGKVYHNDSTNLPLKDNTVDLIITSPPYFNKHTYAKDNWLRLWFLGYDDYREIRRKLCITTSKTKYINFVGKCLEEMYRVLKDNSACFIVVGNIKIDHEIVNMAELLTTIIEEKTDFHIHRIINDPVPYGRKYMVYIPKEKGIKNDQIIELHKGRVKERNTRVQWEHMQKDI